VSRSDADFVREIIPELKHMSDAYLTQHSIDRLQKYVHMLKKQSDDKKEKNIEARLAQNLEEAISRPVRLAAAEDNRCDLLHPARFLPGAAVTMERSWMEARKLWGREPKLAVCEFDLLAIGLPGCIPARAWEILHFPGSRELTLKMFTVANVARASDGIRTVTSQSEDGLVLRESLKELTELSELKTAFRNLKIAAQLVRPWDYSFLVIESFLLSTDYLDAQLAGFKKAPVLAGFLDHVFRVNASNWMQSKPFMDVSSLKALWDPWWSGHKGEMKKEAHQQDGGQQQGQKGKKNQQQQQGGGRGGGNRQGGQQGGQQGGNKGRYTPAGRLVFTNFTMPPPDFSGPPHEKNICRQYNEKSCPNAYNTCVKSSAFGQFRLYHLCNHTELVNGETKLCAQKHAKADHK
jgi:hypothetical protein